MRPPFQGPPSPQPFWYGQIQGTKPDGIFHDDITPTEGENVSRVVSQIDNLKGEVQALESKLRLAESNYEIARAERDRLSKSDGDRMLLVFHDGTTQNLPLFRHPEQGGQYYEFIKTEMQPIIRESYRDFPPMTSFDRHRFRHIGSVKRLHVYLER